MKPKNTPNKKVQYTKCAVALILWIAFCIWLQSWLGIIVIPFIFDAYITQKIKWQWWKESDNKLTVFLMSWVDALVFALVAVYFINQFFFQNYVIPSSSLEKSLLTGDYLFVSKVSYGTRIPETPLTMPLTQHTMPLIGTRSYIEWPHWDYRRVKGLGTVQLNDIVVFNYPAGDTIYTEPLERQTMYYQTCYEIGESLFLQQHPEGFNINDYTRTEQYDIYKEVYKLGSNYIKNNPKEFGDVHYRPTDRRENYVKRCVGLPGQTLQIKNRIVYLDGKPNKEPENVQYGHCLKLRDGVSLMDLALNDDLLHDLGITQEDLVQLSQAGFMPMTKATVKALASRTDLVDKVYINTNVQPEGLFPRNMITGWTVDNFGPVWIPKKGATIQLNMDNICIYERCIKNYEHNDLEVKDGKIFINGKHASSYTFKLDYYWMQGDNRHNSADSRFWGFVPEDHIVGKPIFVWWSSDPDRKGFAGIRWNRIGKWVDNIK